MPGPQSACNTTEPIAATQTVVTAQPPEPYSAPSGSPADCDTVDRYADRLRDLATALGVALGDPRFENDHYLQKVQLLVQKRVAVVSFSFG